MSTEIPIYAWISPLILLLGVILIYSEVKNKIKKIVAIPRFFLFNGLNVAALIAFFGLRQIHRAMIAEYYDENTGTYVLPFLIDSISVLIYVAGMALIYFIGSRYLKLCKQIDDEFPEQIEDEFSRIKK